MNELNKLPEDKTFFVEKLFKKIKDFSKNIKINNSSELCTDEIKKFLKFRAYVLACGYTYANENSVSLVKNSFEDSIEFDNYLMLKGDFHDEFEKKIVEIFYDFKDDFTEENIEFFRSSLFKNEVYGRGKGPNFRVEPRFRVNKETNEEKNEHLKYFISKIKEIVKNLVDFGN